MLFAYLKRESEEVVWGREGGGGERSKEEMDWRT